MITLHMLPRRRRISPMIYERRSSTPRRVLRVVLIGIGIVILWQVAMKLVGIGGSIDRSEPVLLTTDTSAGVRVKLQGGEWQNGETSLTLYSEDRVSTSGGASANLTFFDGSTARLDATSDVLIEETSKASGESSRISLKLSSGRLWVSTPASTTISGSIVRRITTDTFSVSLSPGTSALVSQSTIAIVAASGLGARVSFSIPDTSISDIYVGEGQFLSMTEQAIQDLKNGGDPYAHRDPLTQEMLQDPFLESSYARRESDTSAANQTGARDPVDQVDLTVESPPEGASVPGSTLRVAGRVSDRVASVRVNGRVVTLRPDRSFTVDTNIEGSDALVVTVDALDKQGIRLASIDRRFTRALKEPFAPVLIKAPVGSGGTLTTSDQEVEITGEAPANTQSIIVNDYTLQLFRPGSRTWSYLASERLGNLKPGPNIFAIVAVGPDGTKSSTRSITIDYAPKAVTTGSGTPLRQNAPLEPGSLTITSPSTPSPTEVSVSEVILEGRTSASTATVSVNGYKLSLYEPGKQTWNYVASIDLHTLKRGRNIYRVVARAANGDVLDVIEYTIIYRP